MRDIPRLIKAAFRPGAWLWRVRKLVPYAVVTLSGMLVVFFLIDRVNKPMAFMSNEFHKIITFLLALLSIGQAIRIIALHREEERRDYRKRLRAYQRRAGEKRRSG